MNHVKIAFVPLQVIAFMENLSHIRMLRRDIQEFVVWKQRRFPWTQVRKDHARGFLARIGHMSHGFSMASSVRFGRLIKTTTVPIVEPTMINASKPLGLDTTITQVGCPVGTIPLQQSQAAIVITK
jgi:hypothetical protein